MFADENKMQTDAETCQKIIGTWIIDVKVEEQGIQINEEGFITFASNGNYSAQATENNRENKKFFEKWEGKWQITNSILTTPTTATSGFEDNLHPKFFMLKVRIVHIDENELVYDGKPYWTLSTTNIPTFNFKRAKK